MNKKNIVSGVLLILAGLIWLLSDFGIIDFNFKYFIYSFFELWPLIFIIIGLGLIFKNNTLNNILWLVFLIILVLYGSHMEKNYNQKQEIGREDRQDKNISIDLEERIERGELDLNIGASFFEIKGEEEGFALLKHNGQFNHRIGKDNETQSLIIDSDRGVNWRDRSNNLFLGLNNKLTWNIDIDSGAGKGILDLEDIILQEVNIDMGAQGLEMTLGNKSPTTNIDIDGGASSIDINIPKGSGVRLKLDGALNSTNLKDLDLTERDDYLITEGFEDSPNKFYLDIDMGVGNLNINYY